MSDNDTMKTFGSGLVVLCMLLSTTPFASGMTALGDGDLAAIRAGSGVSQVITGATIIKIDSVYQRDTDTGNMIEFNNIVWDNGSGGAFSFATPLGDPMTVDIGTNAGRTYLNWHDSTGVSPRTFSANLNFLKYSPGANGYDPGYYDLALDIHDYVKDYLVYNLGSLKVSGITVNGNKLMIGAHGGIDFEYSAKIDIGSAQYAYNTPISANALTFTGIHLFGTTVVGAPEDTSAWTSYPGTFKIGDIAGGNPAQIDVGTDAKGVTSARYEFPMTGSIRVQNVTFGGSDFGQLALDGIAVHRLEVQFHP